ncbi:MAG: hypothetical protein ABSF84_03310 [Acidimicrobiales bacterium]|jgi:hypothetical protein
MNSTTDTDTIDSGACTPRAGRNRRIAALSAVGVVALAFAACGGSSAASTTPTTATPTTGSETTPTSLPGASGTIAAVNGTSLEVQNAESGQTTVNYTASTTIRQITTTSASAVTVGSCISAFGKPTTTSSSSTPFGEPITATTVSISQPTSGSCSRGGFGGFGGGTRPGGTRPGGTGSFHGFGGTAGNGSRPAGGAFAGGSFGAASGQVTAVNGSVVTVDETDPRTQKASSVAVTLSGTTTFSTTVTATSSAIVVGQCARAVGTADSTGAVTASSLTISAPTNGTCTSGFGFRGGFGGGAGGPGATTSA